MSESPEALYLRLNNHQGFLTGALAELYTNESMADVTLTAEGQLIRAHQIVLAACSPYFKDIFTQSYTNSQYPIVIIKDMPFADLKAIVDFVYRGEIIIPRHQLKSILANGAELQIKGLHDYNRNNWPNTNTSAVADSGDDNESIDEKNTFKSLTKNSFNAMNAMNGLNGLNACESNEIKTNKKQTRKSRQRSSNERKCQIYGHISSTDNTSPNGETKSNRTNSKLRNKGKNLSNKMNNNYNENDCENSRENASMNEPELGNRSHTIGSAMNSKTNSEHNMENSMTAKAVISGSDIEPFDVLEQSMMIDVKQNVNINANQQSDESSSATSASANASASRGDAGLMPLYLNINSLAMIDNRTECDKQKNNRNDSNHRNEPTIDEIKNKDISDNTIPPALRVMNENSFDETDIQTNSSSSPLISAVESTAKRSPKKRTQRVSKAGIPRKGNSIRSYKKFKCPVCQKVYVSPQNMREHLRNTHTNPDQKYVCAVCEREYSWKHALDRHFKSKHPSN